LGYPERLFSDLPRFSFLNYPSLTFETPDLKNFRNLALAYESIRAGGNMPCVLNAANEIVVGAFLNNRIGFNTMPEIIEEMLGRADFIPHPVIEELVETNRKTRELTEQLISAYTPRL